MKDLKDKINIYFRDVVVQIERLLDEFFVEDDEKEMRERLSDPESTYCYVNWNSRQLINQNSIG